MNECPKCADAQARIAELEAEQEIHLIMLKGKSPCGHWSAYSHTEDGGKHITCFQCRAEAAEAKLNEAIERGDKYLTLGERYLAQKVMANLRADTAEIQLATLTTRAEKAERELTTARETNLDNCDRADWYKAQIENPKMWPGRVPTEQVEQVKVLAEQAKTRCAECGGTGVRKVMRFTDTCPFCTHGQIATLTEGDTR